MARIRSVHPGQWTDEAFVTCSPLARLLAIGLRNEADDGGVFPWKPLTLKMRLLPADNTDVGALLAELEGADIVRRYEVGGVQLGAIRNFLSFQSPKFPKQTHPRLDWVPAYCGDKAASVRDDNGSGTVPLVQRSETATEIRPQMESESESESELDAVPAAAVTADPDPKPDPEPPPKPSKRVRKLADLRLDDELAKLARDQGRDPEAELARFTDWIGAKGKRFDDYRAGFRNWLRSPYGKPANGTGPPERIASGYGFGIS